MSGETVRQRKIGDQVKRLVSQILAQKVKDPRKGMVTITHVKMSGDLRIASVYYTVMGGEKEKEEAAKMLESAKNFIRGEIAPHLKLRFIPELRFFYDDTLDYSMHIEELLKKIKQEKTEETEE